MTKNKNKDIADEVLDEQEEVVTNDSDVEVDESEETVTEEEPEDELEKAQRELAEAKDKYLRLYSEFDNFRRRTAKERLALTETANESLILSLLPVADDFERADKAFNEETDISSVKEGVDLIYNKFQQAIEKKGLQAMDTSEGTDFDPELHDAITQIPAPKPKLKGKIIDTVERGYTIGEKVIRHAKVVVGN
jgi:molecular chaperone GrpE